MSYCVNASTDRIGRHYVSLIYRGASLALAATVNSSNHQNDFLFGPNLL